MKRILLACLVGTALGCLSFPGTTPSDISGGAPNAIRKPNPSPIPNTQVFPSNGVLTPGATHLAVLHCQSKPQVLVFGVDLNTATIRYRYLGQGLAASALLQQAYSLGVPTTVFTAHLTVTDAVVPKETPEIWRKVDPCMAKVFNSGQTTDNPPTGGTGHQGGVADPLERQVNLFDRLALMLARQQQQLVGPGGSGGGTQ